METFEKYGIILPKGKSAGQAYTLCPQCSHTRKKSKDKCLGVNIDMRIWHCNHCAWAGSLKQDKIEQKKYEKPVWKNNTTLSENVVKWFEGRGIRQKTLIDMKISEGMEWMPQIQKESNTIQFNYFRGSELINIKYRDGAKNFKLHKNAELMFYNENSLSDITDAYLVEGEIDCLSMVESGYNNTLSVPNGASQGNNNIGYLDYVIDRFNGVKIHLAFDNDLPGRKLREDFAERFGKERCDYIQFKDCKDANECLQKYGIQGIIESCSNPIKFPLEGTFTISDIDNEIEDMYINGLDMGVSTNIPEFDLRIVKGYLTVITGIPSHGKSDWLDNVCIHLRRYNDWKGAFYSPENRPTQLHFSKLARKLIGKHWDGQSRINDLEKNQVKKYLDKYFWFLKPEKDFSLKSILAQIRTLQQRHGLDFFVIDAWNKLEHIGNADTNYIGKCLDEISVFCEVNNLHCFLVAHPTKMLKNDDGTYQVPTLYNISGSSNFYNKADNGLCIYRDFKEKQTFVYRQKIKFDHWGTEGLSAYSYDLDSKRYYKGNPDNSNWITKPTVQTEIAESAMQPNIYFGESRKDQEPIKYSNANPF
jgi:twinkle protein